MNLSFSPITQLDEPFLFALYYSTRADELTLVPWSEEQKKVFVQSQFQSQHNHYLTEYPNGKFQIINLDYERIGRLYVSESANEIHIIDITILPIYRKKGIGKKIITDILQEAEKPVRIYLESFNQSIGLFKELGFSMISDEGIYQLWEYRATKQLKVNTFGK